MVGAMRIVAVALTLFLVLGLTVPGGPVAAQDAVAGEDRPLSGEARLDPLFDTLATADEDAAEAAEHDIIAVWMESGSDTVDLLMQWTLGAIEAKDYALALDYLDRITALEPEYVEGWNKRATVHFLKEDYAKSIADIERVLALEPRHFGALSGLGTILHEIGEEKRAIEAYKRALAINPHLDNVKKALEDIDVETGRGI